MARIDDVFVTGTIGNIVLYRRMGKPCARVKRDQKNLITLITKIIESQVKYTVQSHGVNNQSW
ncbi:MAG: hypothetical protein KGM16_11850 [Bacteroidota bacterium]|nr:hypothetical protein [Bacteroidota bacterium]